MKTAASFGMLTLAMGLGALMACTVSSTPNDYAGAAPTATADPTEPATDEVEPEDEEDPPKSAKDAGKDSGKSSSSSSSSGSSGSSGTDAGPIDAGPIDAGPPDPLNAAPTCTNGTSTAPAGEFMKPGQACNNCHSFTAAGTVYPTGHEPNNCKGANVAGTTLVVTDATNQTFTLPVNAAGNFHSTANMAFPIRVKVVSGGKTRAMNGAITAAMSGNCNACHSAAGAGSPKAPGRVTMPF